VPDLTVPSLSAPNVDRPGFAVPSFGGSPAAPAGGEEPPGGSRRSQRDSADGDWPFDQPELALFRDEQALGGSDGWVSSDSSVSGSQDRAMEIAAPISSSPDEDRDRRGGMSLWLAALMTVTAGAGVEAARRRLVR
jgi:hypothetical protein